MKKEIFLTAFLFLSPLFSAPNKLYLPNDRFIVTDDGIYFKANNNLLPMKSLSYDYKNKKFFIKKNADVILIICPNCKKETYSPVLKICFNQSCPYQG